MHLLLPCFHSRGCSHFLCKWMALLAACSWLVFSEMEHLGGRNKCTRGFQAEEPGCQAPRDSH